MSSRSRRRVAIAAAVVVAVSATAWAMSPVRARIKALGVLTGATGIPFPRPWARSVEVRTVEPAVGVVGDLYTAGDDAPVVLFVPGATRQGRKDERVIRASRALAAAGRRVFVPELALYDRTFERPDIDVLASAMDALSDDGPIGVLGFSYGGSFSLIAAADPRVAGDLAYVAVFGAYFDLAHVLQAVTTGATILDGEQVPFDTIPEAREILIRSVVRFVGEPDGELLERALRTEDPSELPRSVRAVYALLTNDDPARTDALLEELPQRFSSALDDFSPRGRMNALEAPVFIMQSRKDVATPWPEAIRLDRAAERSRLVMLDHFSHVDPPGLGGWVTDGARAWRFASWVLAAQE